MLNVPLWSSTSCWCCLSAVYCWASSLPTVSGSSVIRLFRVNQLCKVMGHKTKTMRWKMLWSSFGLRGTETTINPFTLHMIHCLHTNIDYSSLYFFPQSLIFHSWKGIEQQTEIWNSVKSEKRQTVVCVFLHSGNVHGSSSCAVLSYCFYFGPTSGWLLKMISMSSTGESVFPP